MDLPKKLTAKLRERKEKDALRMLSVSGERTDFSSNDYLGLAKSAGVYGETARIVKDRGMLHNGAGGSRLLTGNHALYAEVETLLSRFHGAGAALVFNSGYDANTGFFSCVPQRGDIVFYDELIHASIRDGIRMGHARAYRFRHNDMDDLETKVSGMAGNNETQLYIVTESVFSMDGDSPDLEAMTSLSEKYGACLVVDEAHALGVFGKNGEGLVQQYGLENRVFARIMTFGKAAGCHGAAILGPEKLRDYLVNFARSLIYTTALPPHALAAVLSAYTAIPGLPARLALLENIAFFKSELQRLGLERYFTRSDSAIQACIVTGNEKVKRIAGKLRENGFDVKAILSPTVPPGEERLRLCLHSYNSKEEISGVLKLLAALMG